MLPPGPAADVLLHCGPAALPDVLPPTGPAADVLHCGHAALPDLLAIGPAAALPDVFPIHSASGTLPPAAMPALLVPVAGFPCHGQCVKDKVTHCSLKIYSRH